MSARSGEIRIRRDIFSKAVDASKAALLGHEITHLYQGTFDGLSKMGEVAAHYVQTEILDELGKGYTKDFQKIQSGITDGINAGALTGEDMDILSKALVSIDSGYYWVPEKPLLFTRFNDEQRLNFIVEPVRVFQTLASSAMPSTSPSTPTSQIQ